MIEPMPESEQKPEFWTCDPDAERLIHKEISAAVTDWVEANFEPHQEIPKTVEVHGHARVEVTGTGPFDPEVLLDDLSMIWAENEFADPDGDAGEYKSDAAEDRARELTRKFLTDLAQCFYVWHCERVVTKTVKIADYWDNYPEEAKK